MNKIANSKISSLILKTVNGTSKITKFEHFLVERIQYSTEHFLSKMVQIALLRLIFKRIFSDKHASKPP